MSAAQKHCGSETLRLRNSMAPNEGRTVICVESAKGTSLLRFSSATLVETAIQSNNPWRYRFELGELAGGDGRCSETL